jgi:uroporphyrinogen-III synthase
MRVLVTRPADDAVDTAALLEARGHEPVIAPLLGVNYHDGEPLQLDGVQAVLMTSVNGVRAFTRRTSRRDLPVFAVGSQTTQAARAAGFSKVRNADGNSEDLAAAVRAGATPGAGVLLHAAGAQAEGRLADLLAAAGFSVRTAVLYDVPAATDLPAAARDALTAGTLDAALFFSARSAAVFAGLVAKAGLVPACARLTAVCISEAAAKPLAALAFNRICIAARPNQASLLDCLG